jgi:serine/threonine protein kinase
MSSGVLSLSPPPTPRIYCLFMQMEICATTLASNIQERDRCGQAVDYNFNLTVIRQVSAGLASIHNLGLVHRDVKPSNIFMSDDIVKIGDFGVAKDLRKSEVDDHHGAGAQELSNRIKLLDVSSDEEDEPELHNYDLNSREAGTPVYSAPEQLKGRSCSAKVKILIIVPAES